MPSKIEIAKQAAQQLYADVSNIQFIGVLKTGEEKYTATRSGKAGELTITVNPNGTNAAIEWKGRLKSSRSDYRIFRIEGYPTTDDVPLPAAAKVAHDRHA
jgi:hypothetical protein